MRRLRHQEVIPIKSSFTLRVSRFVCSRRYMRSNRDIILARSKNPNPFMRISVTSFDDATHRESQYRNQSDAVAKRRRRSLVKFSI
uniref:Uncharacterized protein n=1 Tax=Brassica oleracea TaxID=3712 RepID=A0A3P6EGC2_BRAOL|nr:unnamed protein product [Brassica oleracea]